MDETDKKFSIIRDALRKEIYDGKFAAGRAFPSETQLVRRFGVSRGTVVRALRELQAAGLILRRQGQATRVEASSARRTGRIALLVHGTDYCEMFAPVARAFSDICIQNGIVLLFGNLSTEEGGKRAGKVLACAREFIATSIDGAVFQPIELVDGAEALNREALSLFDAANVPVVLLDSDIVPHPRRSEYDLASVDHFDAGRRLALHLRETGARRIACMTQRNRAPCVLARCRGVQSGAEGLPLDGKVFFSEPDDAARIGRFVRRERPGAIACYNDRQAAILIQTLSGLGFKVPDDIAVVGFDDVNYARLASPRLTTMHQPCAELAALAFDMLQWRIRHPDAPARQTVLAAPLVLGGSTRPTKRRTP